MVEKGKLYKRHESPFGLHDVITSDRVEGEEHVDALR